MTVITHTGVPGAARPGAPIFARSSSGLIKGWSAYDAFIFNFLAANPILLGLLTFQYAAFFPEGNLVWAVAISGVLLLLQSFVCAALVSIMPRAGGDYLWQSRLIHGAVGMILVGVAWWFMMWHWAPVYQISIVQGLYAPVLYTLGFGDFALWLSTPWGIFIGTLVLIAFITLVTAVGIRAYAKLQKWGFYLGLVTLFAFFAILFFSTPEQFVEAFNKGATETFGAGPNSYQAVLEVGAVEVAAVNDVRLGPTLELIPLVLFFNIWASMGAALYGEVRAASDFRRTFWSMGGAIVLTTVLAVVLLLLIDRTMGWNWYNALNSASLNGADGNPIPIWPTPLLFAAWLLDSKALTLLLFFGLSGWFWGFVGNLFLSSSRTIFAIAYDRVIPEWFAQVSPKRGVPVGALVTLVVGCVVLSAVYAFIPVFQTLLLDGIVPFAVVGIASGIAVAVLPWRGRALFESSHLARWKIGGVYVVTVVGVLYALFLSAVVYLWLTRPDYGVNNTTSLLYLGALYLLAAAIYAIAWIVRKRQGLSLGLAQKEIPVD